MKCFKYKGVNVELHNSPNKPYYTLYVWEGTCFFTDARIYGDMVGKREGFYFIVKLIRKLTRRLKMTADNNNKKFKKKEVKNVTVEEIEFNRYWKKNFRVGRSWKAHYIPLFLNNVEITVIPNEKKIKDEATNKFKQVAWLAFKSAKESK